MITSVKARKEAKSTIYCIDLPMKMFKKHGGKLNNSPVNDEPMTVSGGSSN